MSGDAERKQLSEQLTVLYDDLRTACFNKKYYGRQLVLARRFNNGSEFILAITASGTGIGSWEAFQAGIGQEIWIGLATASALIAIAKPILKLANIVERYAKLHGEYSKLTATLQSVAGQVRMNQAFTPELQKVHQTAQATFSKLADDDDPAPRKATLEKLQRLVNQEIPPDKLWMPDAGAKRKRGWSASRRGNHGSKTAA